jgi:hypothetical protein
MHKLPKTVTYALIAFMAAWQATQFALDYRAVMGSIVAGLMGYLNPGKNANMMDSSEDVPAES